MLPSSTSSSIVQFDAVIPECVDNKLQFNVMPERAVTETLHIKEYRLSQNYIEAHFDRTYESAMLKSPSHLIFLSAVAHYQKMLYVYGCHHLDLGYDPFGPEKLKIWPTVVKIEMPRMLRNETGLVHRVYIDSFESVGPKRYHITTHSDVNNCVFISGESPLFVL